MTLDPCSIVRSANNSGQMVFGFGRSVIYFYDRLTDSEVFCRIPSGLLAILLIVLRYAYPRDRNFCEEMR